MFFFLPHRKQSASFFFFWSEKWFKLWKKNNNWSLSAVRPSGVGDGCETLKVVIEGENILSRVFFFKRAANHVRASRQFILLMFDPEAALSVTSVRVSCVRGGNNGWTPPSREETWQPRTARQRPSASLSRFFLFISFSFWGDKWMKIKI